MVSKASADPAKMRTLRMGVLGPQTARCEKCLGDCTGQLDTWVVLGLCDLCNGTKAKQQRMAGR